METREMFSRFLEKLRNVFQIPGQASSKQICLKTFGEEDCKGLNLQTKATVLPPQCNVTEMCFGSNLCSFKATWYYLKTSTNLNIADKLANLKAIRSR